MLDLTYETPKVKTIAGAKYDWELVIGMEVHAQVSSNAKLFSGASTLFGAEPNSNVAFVDAAMPGMLPVINEYCVEQAVRTGRGLKAEINLTSAFDRKNYFYPDLPQGYQISQLYHPIVGEGEVLVEMGDGTARLVRVERIHMEQDAGKSIHDMDPNMSFVDLNRTGVCLMEIVSRPDIRGPEEAAAYLTKLRQILRYLGTCDGNMQNGSMRADVNVSICLPGAYEKYQETQDFSHLGTRCEIKNMNSLRFIQAAIDYEARRQIAILEGGGSVDQETRLYDPDKGRNVFAADTVFEPEFEGVDVLQGLKLRIPRFVEPGRGLVVGPLEALGVTVTEIPYAEAILSIERGAVDGGFVTLADPTIDLLDADFGDMQAE